MCRRGLGWSQRVVFVAGDLIIITMHFLSYYFGIKVKGERPCQKTKQTIIREGGQGGHLQPFSAHVREPVHSWHGYVRLPAAVGGMREIIKTRSYCRSGQQ